MVMQIIDMAVCQNGTRAQWASFEDGGYDGGAIF
jgi:hypothetical protein